MQLNYTCKICNYKFNNFKGIGRHLLAKHNINAKIYYDTYLKSNNEGICKLCGNNTNFINLIKGYAIYCSSKCVNNDPDIKNKICATNIKKYGTKYGLSNSEVIEKRKQTCLEKYGVENVFQIDYIKEKSKKTCLEKYGSEYYAQSSERNYYYMQTCLEKYGVEHYSQTDEYKEKYRNTCLEKYGVEYYSQTNEFFKKYLNSFKNNKDTNTGRFRSSWELKYENYLKENNIPYEVQPKCEFWYLDYNNKKHRYQPDFKIELNNIIKFIEIKGDYFFDINNNFYNPYDISEEGRFNALAKYKCMIENNIVILRKQDLINLGIEIN